MLKILLLVFILTLSTIVPIYAQEDTMQNYVAATTPDLIETYQVPAASVALIQDGEITYAEGFGIANEETELAATGDTIYNVASIAKIVTAWGTLKLVEEGKLDLDAPVSQYLTRWELPPSEFNDEVTIRRILSHTAGLSVEGYAGYRQSDELPTLEGLLDGDAGQAVAVIHEPGTEFQYSGGGFVLLQLIIEEVTEQDFAEYMSEAVLEPLGMENSVYGLPEDENLALPYQVVGLTLRQLQFRSVAAGGFYTTANDFAKFMQALTSTEENEAWISPENRAIIFAPAEATDDGYGFGVFRYQVDEETIYWHDGINRGWRSIFVTLPSGTSLVVLTNSNNGSRVYGELMCGIDSFVTENLSEFCTEF